mmetsp:Transcript_11662/g.13200  ORF Transcript_11662/g.13200 Transcript_11662/m.13200 type:complete len:114 (+) Transcript_11662:909-1250(+)
MWYKILISETYFFLARAIWYEILVVLTIVATVLVCILAYYILSFVLTFAYKVFLKTKKKFGGYFTLGLSKLNKFRKYFYKTKSENNRQMAAQKIEREQWISKSSNKRRKKKNL